MIDFDIPKTQKNVAVALSGGGDSMALAHMVCVWAAEEGRQIHLLSVNHNLRDEAEAEARQIARWVQDWPHATHKILTWNFENKPETAVMESARKARYDLMADYCRVHDIQTLCVAHHADDQLETFLFRLSKGSGLDGLTGMRVWSDYDGGIEIYRPLLNLTHNDLIKYCKINNLQWIEDPSNEDETYARPRLRKALAEEGLDTKRFVKTLTRLQRGQEALAWMTEEVFKQCVSFLPHEGGGDALLDIEFDALKTYPIDIQIRVLQKGLMHVGAAEHSYPPKLERVEEILQTIKPNKCATLFGCVLSLSKDGKSLEVRVSKP